MIQHIKYFRQSPTCGSPTSADTQCITDSLLPGWMKGDNMGKEANYKKRNAGWHDRGRESRMEPREKAGGLHSWVAHDDQFQAKWQKWRGSSGYSQKDRVWQVWENTAESFLIFASPPPPLTFIATVRRSGRPRFLLYVGIKVPSKSAPIIAEWPAGLLGTPGLWVLLT